MNGTISPLLIALCILSSVLLMAGCMIWVERRLLALWQDRLGPDRLGPLGILQIAADVIKIMAKEDWIPPFSDKPLFVAAPSIIMITTLLPFAVISFSPGIVVCDLGIGLLFYLAMSSLGVYSVVLAGWSAGGKYPLLGALRAAGQMFGYEVFMGLSVMGTVMLAGSFDLRAIVEAQRNVWFCIPQFSGFLIFTIAGLAETRRLPFDLPESENELVAGYHTEYSGMKFGMFFVGEYAGIILVSAIITTLFLGGWLGPLVPGIPWFFAKMAGVVVVFILCRASLSRPRYDQLISFGWKIMLPLTLLNLLATAAVVLARRP
jgi:NADH-quinone oxidoreductase subunit H